GEQQAAVLRGGHAVDDHGTGPERLPLGIPRDDAGDRSDVDGRFRSRLPLCCGRCCQHERSTRQPSAEYSIAHGHSPTSLAEGSMVLVPPSLPVRSLFQSTWIIRSKPSSRTRASLALHGSDKVTGSSIVMSMRRRSPSSRIRSE